MRPTVRRYRLLRSVFRLASVAVPGRRKAALERLLRATFGETVEAGGHLLDVHPEDRPLGARLRRRGVWSEAETALYLECIRPGQTVVDCGAHVGYFTLIFARCVGPAGRVVAFEPEPANHRLLSCNVARNGYRNVTCVEGALGRATGRTMLSLASENLGDHRIGPPMEGRTAVEVSLTTLDRWIDDHPGSVDFLKLDVQGAEPAVLDGAWQTLSDRARLSMLTEFWPRAIDRAGEDPRGFLERITAAGFTISVLAGPRSLIPIRSAVDRERLCDDATDVNLFCCKGPSPIDD